MNRLLQGLNSSQQQAVETTDGPLLVIAGAGSGKTRVLTRRVAYLLTERLAEPYQVLAVTFTNKAAGEMRQRVGELLGGTIPELQVATFHSFCARLLRNEADQIGYTRDFTIFDSDDSKMLVKNCLKELGFTEGQFPHRAQLRRISELKNKLISAEQFDSTASGYFEMKSSQIYTLYQRRLRQCNAMDFDDLLLNSVLLLKNNEHVQVRYQNRFKYMLVDEYQDTNHVQYKLLTILAAIHQNICVVGDEDQSIYGWRGADIRNILDFEKDFPGAKIIKLEQNYRSTANILSAASEVIKNNEMRKGKTLTTDQGAGEKIHLLMVDNSNDEAEQVVNRIEKYPERYRESAILYRTNAQSRSFEEHLRRRNIPYQIYGGISFYARKEIKDLLAYLRLIVNPKDDISFNRIVNYPKRGIGNKSLEHFAEIAKSISGSHYDVLQKCEEYDMLSGKVKRLLPFRELIDNFKVRAENEPVDIIVQDLVEELHLIEELSNEDPVTGQTRVENIEAFIEGAAEFARTNAEAHLSEYLQEISLFTDLDKFSDTDDKVALMTVHSAKGLEFDSIYLVGLEEGRFPLQRAIMEPTELEEERRLFYVALTRARMFVHLSLAAIRFQFGEVESIPSRFVKEIPKELVEKRNIQSRRSYSYVPSSSHQSDIFSGQSHPRVPSQPVPTGTYYEYEENEMARPGRIVAHPTFGRGKILKAEGMGESLRLEIMFSGVGVKKIMAKFARLKIVG